MGDALNFWYHLIPVDVSNITWISPSFRTLPQGNYVCHAYAENSYGVISSAVSEFQVDTTAPSLYLNSPQNRSYTTNDLQLLYITDADVTRIYLDNLELTNPLSGQFLYDLAEGEHNLTLICMDLAGNIEKKQAYFVVDTIPPNLTIVSPYSSYYHQNVRIEVQSDGSTILYFIEGVHSFNQTYSDPLSINLSVGEYMLSVLAYDDAGNVRKKMIQFAIVAEVALLLNSQLEAVDSAGNYLITTQLLANPDFDIVILELNGSMIGGLTWNVLENVYTLEFTLLSPGTWDARLIARTTLNEYDFVSFLIEWNPPSPKFQEIYVHWNNDQSEVWVEIDDNSLPIKSVILTIDTATLALEYEAFWNRWVAIIQISPQNYSFDFSIWYPWDIAPSAELQYNSLWFTPSIIVESYSTTRESFILEIRVEKQNASIDTVILTISNGSIEQRLLGDLLYESVSGSYQRWRFSASDLDHSVWTLTANATDIFGSSSILTRIFNSTDNPPSFGNHTLSLLRKSLNQALYRIEIPLSDDFQIQSIILHANDVIINPLYYNSTYLIFEFWLNEGTYMIQIIAVDDSGQQSVYIIPSLTVIIDHNDNSTHSSSQSSSDSIVPPSGNQTNPIIELGLGGSIFASLVAIGQGVTRKRRA